MKKGTRHTAETRERMSEARKKAWADPEVRQRMSAATKKALADPAVRQRMSAAHKKAWADPEVRQRMSAARKGMKYKKHMKDKFLCDACNAGNCNACDGGSCRCVCALELDVRRRLA